MSSENKENGIEVNGSYDTNNETNDENMETFITNKSKLGLNEENNSNFNHFVKQESNDSDISHKTSKDQLNGRANESQNLLISNGINGELENISDEPLSDEETNGSSDEEEMSSDSIGEELNTNRVMKFINTTDEEQSLHPLPDTVTVLEGPNGAQVYLVGTAHFSEKSQQDVSQTIRRVQPNIVVLELCESRLSILSFDEKSILEESKTMGIAKMRRNIQEYGVVQGVMYILLLSLSAHLTKELGMAPGGEFRRAFNEANRVPGCVVHLGDRPVHITLRRAISSLGVWQKLKLAFGIIFNNESISKEEVEKCKQRDLLEEMLAEMTGEFPALSKVFVHERDTYLAYSLWLASSPIPDMSSPTGSKPAVVVGVVGIGHVPGIVKQWGKVTDKDIPPLLKLPETSLTTKIIKKSVKYSFIGLAVWGCYKLLVPTSINNAISDASLQTISWIQKSVHN